MWAPVLTFVALAAAEPLPNLETIKKKPPTEQPVVKVLPVPATAPSTSQPIEEIPLARRVIGVVLAAKVGGSFFLPRGLGFAGAVEIGYRFPFLRRVLGLSVEAAMWSASWERSSTFGTEQVDALGISPSVLASAHADLGPGTFRLLVGPTLQWLEVRQRSADAQRRRDALGFGLSTAVGYFFHLPFGALGVEGRYQWMFPGGPAAPDMTHQFAATVGYVIAL